MLDPSTTPEAIVGFFLADPLGLDLSVRRNVADLQSPIHGELNAFVATITEDDVALARQDSRLPFDLYDDPRVLLAERLIGEQILHHRLLTLLEDVGRSRPRPYDHPALADLELDEHQMVALSQFEFDDARLVRNGLACLPLSTTGAPNSTWWLLTAIYQERLTARTRVRLDPYLLDSPDRLPAMTYKMYMYGRPLDWDRIDSLRQPEHGTWLPDLPGHPCPFTDFVWDPRDSEVHFACEEVPATAGELASARYFHAIYDPQTRVIDHLDGAVRIYSARELEHRRTTHVKDAGKVGLRLKVFRADGPVSRASLSLVAQAFFVWNDDVARYFDHGSLVTAAQEQ